MVTLLQGGGKKRGGTTPPLNPTSPLSRGARPAPMGLAAAAKAAAAAAATGGSLNFSALDSKDSDKLAEQPERPWTWSARTPTHPHALRTDPATTCTQAAAARTQAVILSTAQVVPAHALGRP